MIDYALWPALLLLPWGLRRTVAPRARMRSPRPTAPCSAWPRCAGWSSREHAAW